MKTIICPDCGIKKTKGARCWDCRRALTAKPIQHCGDCGRVLSRSNRIGLCRTHSLMRSAEIARQNPEYLEKLRELGRSSAAKNLHSPEVRSRWLQSRAQAGRKRTETALGWCPPAYREAYRKLLHRSSWNAAMARAEIMRRIDHDKLGKIAAVHSSNAAHYLRRLAPVTRRDDGWHYGTALLTPEQLIERAMQKGWQPDRWAA